MSSKKKTKKLGRIPKLSDIYSQKLKQIDGTAVFFLYLYCGENHYHPTGTVNVVGKKTTVYSYPQAKSPSTHTYANKNTTPKCAVSIALAVQY